MEKIVHRFSFIISPLMQYYETDILLVQVNIKRTALELQKKKVKLNSLVEIV